MISVIVPVYNVEPYLNQCVSSIVNQTYKDLEIILVNDGSTDNSGKICEQWGKKDTRITVVNQSNGGLSCARNTGIQLAQGEYISFIDSDDFIKPTYFEYLYRLLKSVNADISVCQVDNINDDGTSRKNTKITILKPLLVGSNECMSQFLSDTAIDTTAWRKLYRKELFDKNGIKYPVGKYHEDVYTTYKLIANANKVIIGEERLYCYRHRRGSIINSKFSSKHLDSVKGKIERLKYIESRFPNLKNKATPGIIYSANQCVLKMLNSKDIPKADIKYLQQVYNTYSITYIKASNGILQKLFTIASWLNLSLFLKILQKIKILFY